MQLQISPKYRRRSFASLRMTALGVFPLLATPPCRFCPPPVVVVSRRFFLPLRCLALPAQDPAFRTRGHGSRLSGGHLGLVEKLWSRERYCCLRYWP